MKQKESYVITIFPYAVLCGVGLLLCIRAFFGFDWSDECYYAALPYRFLEGDRFFIDSWDIHQTSAMLLVPLLWCYRTITGNMDGILLCLRLVFIATQTAISFLCFRVIYHCFSRRLSAFFCALFFLSFTPFTISSFSYNTLGHCFLFLCLIMLLLLYYGSDASKKRWYAWLAGSFFALACIAYPFFVVAAFPLGILFFVLPPDGKTKTAWPFLLWVLLGVLFVLFPIFLYLCCTSGFFNMIENFEFILLDPEHPSENLWYKSLNFLKAFYDQLFLGPFQIGWLVCSFFSFGFKRGRISFFHLTRWIIPFFCFASVVYYLLQPDAAPSKANIFQSCAGLWPLILFVQKPDRQSAALLFIFYIPSLFLSWAVYLASNNGMNGASYPLFFGILTLVLLLDSNRAAFSIKGFKSRKREKCLQSILFVFLIGLNLGFRVGTVYRDEPIACLTVQLQSGPAKGLYTTASSAVTYEGILGDIRLFQQEGRILFHKLLPFGYLYAQQRPATPSLWRISFPSERMEKYYLCNPQNRPAVLYSLKVPYGEGNGQVVTDQEATQVFGCAVRMLETSYAVVYMAAF